MTEEIKSFNDKHSFKEAANTVLLPTEATQLAIATGVAAEKHTAIFADQKWFNSTDLTCKYLDIASVFASDDVELPKYLWAAEARPTSFVFAVAQTAIQEMLAGVKKVCQQYKQVDLKMMIFTPNEMRLWEGVDRLREKLNMQLSHVSLAGRQLGMCGGGHRYAWMADAPHAVRTATTFQLPQRQILPLLMAGQDPLRIFAKLPKNEERVAISILNKYVEELMKELNVPEEQVAVAPGPHPTLTSWLISPPPTQEVITAIESKWFQKENYSMVPLKVQQGDLAKCHAIAEVYLGKQHRTHNKITTFWATLYFHLAQSMDTYQHRPLVQYESTNKIRLGFITKEDAQQFIKGSLPKLKELGYSFKTEGTKDEFWDGDSDTASVGSASSTRSWRSTGSRKPAGDDQVVFVDLPEFLPPKQLWDLVQQALKAKSIETNDCAVNFTKLKWSMGSIRKPNWLLSAPGVAKIAGAVLTMTGDDGTEVVATVRSKAEWDKAREEWVAKRPAKPQNGQPQSAAPTLSLPMQAPAPPISVFQPIPGINSLLPNQQVTHANPMPNLLHPPQGQPGVNAHQPLDYLAALLTQSQQQQTPQSQKQQQDQARPMQLDIASVRGKRPRAPNESDTPF